MDTIKPLEPAMLCRHCDPASFTFETTAELEDLHDIIGQPRAIEAVQFGIGMRHEGYNLFVLGPPGIGKHALVRQFLGQEAVAKSTPDDWCYVNNFEQPYKPRVLRLPPGQGLGLCQDMNRMMEELQTTIPAVFDSEDYRTRKQVLLEEFKEREEKAFEELKRRATEHGFALMKTPVGLAFAPVHNGHVLSSEQYDQLPEVEQERIKAELAELQEQLQATIQEAPRWEREFRERLKMLNREVALLAVGHLVAELRQKYSGLPAVVSYLDAVQQDIVEHVDDFRPAEESSPAALNLALSGAAKDASPFRRYQVNLLVDNSSTQGAPVIFEDHPTDRKSVV